MNLSDNYLDGHRLVKRFLNVPDSPYKLRRPLILLVACIFAVVLFSCLSLIQSKTPLPVGSIRIEETATPFLLDGKVNRNWAEGYKFSVNNSKLLTIKINEKSKPAAIDLTFRKPVQGTGLRLSGTPVTLQKVESYKESGRRIRWLFTAPVETDELSLELQSDVEKALIEVRVIGSPGGTRGAVGLILRLSMALLLFAFLYLLFSRKQLLGSTRLEWGMLFLVAAIPLTLVWRAGEMPLTTDGYYWHLRTQIFVEQLLNGQLIPVWSTSTSAGYGSPQPVLYHKLYTFVSSLLMVATGSGYFAHLVTLWCFFVLWTAGIFRCLVTLQLTRRWALALTCLLPFLSYPINAWFFRGAMAEVTALALVPWVFWWCILALDKASPRKLFFVGFPIFLLTYLAHTAIFFITALPVVISLVTCLWRERHKLAFLSWITLLGMSVGGIAGTFLVVQLRLGEGFQFFEGLKIHDPVGWLIPRLYFKNTIDTWLAYENYFRFDTILWPIAFVLVFGYASKWKRPGFNPMDPRLLLILGSIGYYVFLMMPPARVVYENVPGFNYIQFPYRLLGLCSTLSLLLIGFLARSFIERNKHRAAARICALAIFLATIAVSPVLYLPEVKTSEKEIVLHTAQNAERTNFVGPTFEYYPAVEGVDFLYPTYRYMLSLNIRPGVVRFENENFSLQREAFRMPERMGDGYEVENKTSEPVVVPLPVNYTDYHRVYLNGERIEMRTPSTDPRIHVEIPVGVGKIYIKHPTFAYVLVGKALDPPRKAADECS
jgi:hypothetical protein